MAGFNAKNAVVAVPHRSGFDKSFRSLLSAKCGTEVPILCDELIPNSDVDLDLAFSVTLPPLAAETFMNVNYKVEAFFVPTRLLMAGYEDWLTGNDSADVPLSKAETITYMRAPVCQLTRNTTKPGTLADYLGFMRSDYDVEHDSESLANVCAFPFLAYHFIWNEWYRNSLVQKDIFTNSFQAQTEGVDRSYSPQFMKWYTPREASNNYLITQNMLYTDNVSVFGLRQRNFGSDYFTTATPQPQNGQSQKVSMVLPYAISGETEGVSDDSIFIDSVAYRDEDDNRVTSLSFTIQSLRNANSMQQFLERNNICGNRLVDYVKGHYGANLKDSIAQRPVYLGSFSSPVYTKGIYQSQNDVTDSTSTNNPFKSVGARYGHAYAEGVNNSLIHFHVDEPGYIMVLGCLVPEVTYATGCAQYLSRYTQRSSQSDLANPILQNVGYQPIFQRELDAAAYFRGDSVEKSVFGYTPRYEDWKIRRNEIHGLLKDGENLESFALQRTVIATLADSVRISSLFLTIPTTYMDQVTAVEDSISDYGYWADFYFNYRVSMPLYDSCIPSLQDPAYEHGNVFKMQRGGTQIN